MKYLVYRQSLRWKLATVITLKILFLCAFWQLVLKHEAVHATTASMTAHLLSTLPSPQE